ncbi:MAG: hypothetical protein IT262_16900, partial [Saprospiraceae bacterium]|nr:hypothetical protein [Saprospiraceae bacterium]
VYDGAFSPAQTLQVQARAYNKGMIASKLAEKEVQTYNMKPALQLFRAPEPGLRLQVLSATGKYTAESVEAGTLERTADVREISPEPACQSGPCGMIWKGYFNAPQTGGYQFWTESDDGSILYVDTEIVVDNDGDHGMEEKTGQVYLQKGFHTFKLLYFNSSGGGGLRAWFAPPGGVKQAIPGVLISH